MTSFRVDIASIEKKFPKGMTVPPLLKPLGAFLAKLEHGSLGYFEAMAGGKYRDDALSKEANKKIADATGIFMSFGEGSELALWNHGEGPPAVVLIDSEGQHRTVAPSFEAFLDAWSKRKSGTELDGKYLDDAPEQQHEKLRAWLRAKKVTATKAKAPDFAKWVAKLSKTDAPPKSDGLPPPPKDMAARALASLGKGASDPKLAALLAELGIDLKSYKTADAQRHLIVAPHGYKLSFRQKKLDGVEFTNKGYSSWDYVNGKDAVYEAYPHDVFKGAGPTDKIDAIKKKLGKTHDEDAEGGRYYWTLPGNVQLFVSCVDNDETDGPLKPGTVEYFSISIREGR
jgi:hypothetical protein